MDSEQLRQAIQFIVGDRYYFDIISSRDLASFKIKKDRTSFIIVHKSASQGNVGHFILFESTYYKRNIVYIDSYGLDPLNYLDFIPFRISFKNRRQLQDSKSNLCGFYILFYIYCRVQLKLSVHQTLDFFTSNTKNNDKKILKFASSLTKRMKSIPHTTRCNYKAMCMCDYITFMSNNAV